jgi:anti-sigma B factor antagonist
MAPLLQSATTPPDGDAVVTVRGDIDTETAGQLWQYLSYLVGQGHHHIVLDLRGMILIDSAGVEILARVSAWTRRKGGDLQLRSLSPALAEQLELARRAEARRHHPSAANDQPPPEAGGARS